MNDFIKIPLENGSHHYLNLEKIIEILFKEDENKVEFFYGTGVIYLSYQTSEGFEKLKEVINKEMEKRILL